MSKIFKNFLLLIILLPVNLSLSKVGPKILAPNFYLKDLQGTSHFLNDYCGEKKTAYKKNEKNVVLISFFATWCLPCREEYPIFHQLQSLYKNKRVKIFLIDVEEKEGIVRKYSEDFHITLPILLDQYGLTKEKYKVTTIPHLFLIDPQQYIIYEKNGFDPQFPLLNTLQTKIDSLLKLHFPVH